MSADGPPSNIPNANIDTPKAFLSPNSKSKELDNLQPRANYTSNLAASVIGN